MAWTRERTALTVLAPVQEPFWQQAEAWSRQLHLPLLPLQNDFWTGQTGLALVVNADGLSLTDGKIRLRADFAHSLNRIHHLGQELLVRAARVKGKEQPLLVDATAGLGEDALLLAAAGFRVLLFEYDPVIAALLQDALRRGTNHTELAPIVSRMQLFAQDSIAALPQLPQKPDVILLDPMFPSRQKSALVKKKFQLLQQLESPCSREEALLQAALAAHPDKIIIKRPVKGPYLAGQRPTFSYTGKAIRVDCIVPPPADR